MKKLSERLEALTGPCRKMDADILVQCCGYTRAGSETITKDDKLYYPDGEKMGYWVYPALTSSLDAITALIERDKHMWILEQGGKNLYSGQVCTNGEYIGWISSMDAPNPAIALCIAFVKVKEVDQ